MATIECPHCGQPLEIGKPNKKKGRFDWLKSSKTFESSQKRQRFDNAAAIPQQNALVPYTSRETPAHLPNFDSHVRVPLTQALITGMFVAPIGALALGSIAHFGYIETTGRANAWGVLLISCMGGVATFLIVAGAQWLSRVGAYDALLWRFEEATGMDINQDEQVGKPERHRVEVEVKDDHSNRWQFAEFEVEPDKLKGFAKDILSGKGFSERTAVANGITQAQWAGIRDRFIDRLWAQWKNPEHPKVGVELTHRGRAVLQTIAHSAAPRGGGDLADRWEWTD